VLGNLVPLLWDAGPLSFSSIIFTGLGGLLGIWIGFKLNNQKYNLAKIKDRLIQLFIKTT